MTAEVSHDTSRQQSNVFRIGVSAEKEDLFRKLVKAFDAVREPGEELVRIKVNPVREARVLIHDALRGAFDAISPDSTVWLDQLEVAWQEQTQGERPLIVEYTVFAVSPIVIVMRASRARSLGYPHRSIGWTDLAELAANDDIEFAWSHPAPRDSGAGLLASLAEFYAGVGKGNKLTREDLVREDVAHFVQKLEGRIAEYGISAAEIAKRAIREGRWFVDAFAVEEHVALQSLQTDIEDQPVIIYPTEGTLWAEHALALCSHDPEASARRAYDAFREHLVSADAQARILASGFRPAGPHYQAYLATTVYRPLAERHVMPTTTSAFSTPATAVHLHALGAWGGVKRPTNIYLVADVSGSMGGHKLSGAQEGLSDFVECITSDTERVGLIIFNQLVQELVPIDLLSRNRERILRAIADLRAGGETALLDATAHAYRELERSYDKRRMQAIVVMTDGRENASRGIDAPGLQDLIEAGKRSGQPIAIYCIAYGEDADQEILGKIADISKGGLKRGTLGSIQKTYDELSHFF